MKDVSELIANLSPEKRAAFMQRLKSKSGKPGKIVVEKKEEPVYVPKAGENYYCHIGKPGNFNSIVLKPKAITPPKADEVQILAKAASLNFRDILIGMNMYYDPEAAMGTDYAGVVTAVGAEVKEFKPGDEVFFFSTEGLQAYHNTTVRRTTLKPKNISWEEAAGIPTVYMTSYYALKYVANLTAGQSILIHTATGGVGYAAIQIARWLGAEIFVTAGTDKKRDFLKSIGFKDPMDSRSLLFADQIMERTNGKGVDVILNTIAGEATAKGLDILSDYGHFLQIDLKDIAKNGSIPLAAFTKNLSFTALNMGNHPEKSSQYMEEVGTLHAEGKFKPLICNSFNINELGRALAFLSKSEHLGKVVLKFDH